MYSSTIIYAIELERLSRFYTAALNLTLLESDEDFHRLAGSDKSPAMFELVLLQAPAHIASQVVITSPPEIRGATPIKPVFTQRDPIAVVRDRVTTAGGLFNAADSEWHFHENRVCDGVDPEGNVFQIRTLDFEAQPLLLREATPNDLELLESWDQEPHVIASGIDGEEWQWKLELERNPEWRQMLIAMHAGKPIGFVQVIDPALEDSHYWGEVPANLRAIDIWLGDAMNLSRGYGSAIMQKVLANIFSDPGVDAVLIDPLARNLNAHRFYERLGFEFIEERTFDDDDCFVYRLSRERFLAH